MKSILSAALLTASAIALVPHAGYAQSTGGDLAAANNSIPDNFARDRDVSVRDRPRPEYEAAGIPVSSFTLHPQLETDLSYDDNIYAINTNKVGDAIFAIKPSVQLQSMWSRHSLNVFANGTINKYADHTSEDTNDWQAGFNGRLDILRTDSLFGGADAGRYTEPRSASGSLPNATRPVQYDYDQLNATYAHTFNRVKLSGRIDERRYDYDDVPTTTGGTIDEDFRDRNETYLTGRADYAVSPDMALFIQGAWNKRNYSQAPTLTDPDRNSTGYELLGGANFDLTSVVRGEVGLGYLSQNYDTKSFADEHGLGVRTTVDWFITPLTTINGVVSRGIEDSGIPGSGAFVATNSALTVDHELLRNLILTGRVGYGHDTYNGIDRVDDHWSFGASASWFLNRLVGINFGFTRSTQSSSGANAGPNFDEDRATVALILHD